MRDTIFDAIFKWVVKHYRCSYMIIHDVIYVKPNSFDGFICCVYLNDDYATVGHDGTMIYYCSPSFFDDLKCTIDMCQREYCP